MASWPKWAQRHIVLGLDLQGGSHILLEVDTNAVRKEKLETLRDDVRRVLRDARVGYTGLVCRGNSVEVRIREGSNFDQAVTKLRELSPADWGILSGTGQTTLDITTEGEAWCGSPSPSPRLLTGCASRSSSRSRSSNGASMNLAPWSP